MFKYSKMAYPYCRFWMHRRAKKKRSVPCQDTVIHNRKVHIIPPKGIVQRGLGNPCRKQRSRRLIEIRGKRGKTVSPS